MKHTLFTLFFVSVTGISFSQIEISTDTQERKKEIVIENDSTSNGFPVEIFFTTNWSKTNRLLEQNDGLFGDTLGVRAGESSLNVWSFGLGFRSQFHKYLAWEGGISYLRNGESYNFEESDSTFSYETSYSYISMPIKLNFVYGKSLKFIAGVGIIPQMFVGYKQVQEWTTSLDSKGDQEIKERDGYNSFVLSTVFDLGGQIKMSKKMSLIALAEYRLQLTNSYIDNASYKHYGRAFGITFGLTYEL